MKKILLPLLFVASSYIQAQPTNISKVSPKVKESLKTFGNKFNFQYGVEFIGPSLDSSAQEGATYNRFKTGQDYKNDDNSGIASHQLYHSTKLGYRINSKYSASYTYTFQEDLNSGIKYEAKNFDGSVSEYERSKGVSDNNKRLNLSITGIVDNKIMFINSTVFYEFPSTVGSENDDMNYGIGINPVIGFYNNNPAFISGITGSIERYYFKRQEYYTKCGEVNCKYPQRYQTLKVNIHPYLGYVLNDVVTLQSTLKFDWDQKGNEVNGNDTYNKNMDDVAEIGANYNIDFGIQASSKLQFVMDDPGLEKTAMLLGLTITVY